jgi:flagellar L-ring protein precursor FlgH
MKITAVFSNLSLSLPLLVCAVASAGNLYQPDSFQTLTADHKAHHAGDLITVIIFENSSASSTANTTAGRDARIGLNVNGVIRSRDVGLGTNNQLNGRGQTQRQGQILAQITVSVKSVADNGDLLIGGEQLLEVNNEKQQIKLQGRIRAGDVSESNTVLSTRVADAKISFVGEGDLADRQRPSWWHRVLTLFGL